MATKRINIWDEIGNKAGSRIRSMQWYNEQISLIKSRGLLTKNKLTEYKQMVTPKLEIGSMYLYVYDPKWKDTLPWYDTFPLCLPFGWDNQTFTGFNLHYLPPEARWVLLKQLMKNQELSVTRRLSKDAKLALDYEALKGASQYKLLQPTIHKYLYTHVAQLNGGMFLKIHPADWLMTVLLPVQDFKTKNRSISSQKVWADSLNQKTM